MIDIIVGIILIIMAFFFFIQEMKVNWDNKSSYFDNRVYYLPLFIGMVILGVILVFTEVSLADIFLN